MNRYDIQGRYIKIKIENFEDDYDCYDKTKMDCFFNDIIRDKCKSTCAQYNIKSKLITGPDQKFAKLVDNPDNDNDNMREYYSFCKNINIDIDCSNNEYRTRCMKTCNNIVDCKNITDIDCSSNILVRRNCTSKCKLIYPDAQDYDCINVSKKECYFNDNVRNKCFDTCYTFYPDMSKFDFNLNTGPYQKFAKFAVEPDMLLCRNDYMFCANRSIDCNNDYFKSVCRKKCIPSCNK
jgi:hypothetical protein